eukprot:TRINITY_DN711_c0_g1_i6.p1 TRINITY_DN711_c0_g1~~TRINITY_DN711_c0_g1_i6.p1  ORF type:complete len:243 (+),score=48.56 TRINITY_DN711_c0_g1_i6:38-766(+)
MLKCPNKHLLNITRSSNTCCGELQGRCVEKGVVHETTTCEEGCLSLCEKCCVVRRFKQTELSLKVMESLSELVEDRIMTVLDITNTCPNGHDLIKTQESDLHIDWLCDGSADAGGCTKRHDTGHWVCASCNFDLCDICLVRRKRIALIEECSDPPPPPPSDVLIDSEEEEYLFLQAAYDTDSSTDDDDEDDQTPCESDLSTSSLRHYALLDPPASPVSSGSPRCQVIKDSIRSVSNLCDSYR